LATSFDLTLTDPRLLSPRSIDLILGADIYSNIIEDGLIKGSADIPVAQKTKLGWMISGPTSAYVIPNSSKSYHVSADQELYDLLHSFWEIDKVSTSSSHLSIEEQECEDHFKSTHQRDSTGRYIVRLPFKQSPDKLGNSKIKVISLMTQLAKRFSSDFTYAQTYKQFMTEYEQLSHMKQILPDEPEPKNVYYLPHHGVLRDHSLTTKLRVVFNGSSFTTSGFSLNDVLHTGAKLQTDLFNVLIWF